MLLTVNLIINTLWILYKLSRTVKLCTRPTWLNLFAPREAKDLTKTLRRTPFAAVSMSSPIPLLLCFSMTVLVFPVSSYVPLLAILVVFLSFLRLWPTISISFVLLWLRPPLGPSLPMHDMYTDHCMFFFNLCPIFVSISHNLFLCNQ